MISTSRLSDASTPPACSQPTQSASGIKGSVSVENLNELISLQDNFTDAYDQYEQSQLKMMDVEVVVEAPRDDPTADDATADIEIPETEQL